MTAGRACPTATASGHVAANRDDGDRQFRTADVLGRPREPSPRRGAVHAAGSNGTRAPSSCQPAQGGGRTKTNSGFSAAERQRCRRDRVVEVAESRFVPCGGLRTDSFSRTPAYASAGSDQRARIDLAQIPRRRPIQAAILNGEAETGVTIFKSSQSWTPGRFSGSSKRPSD